MFFAFCLLLGFLGGLLIFLEDLLSIGKTIIEWIVDPMDKTINDLADIVYNHSSAMFS